ncbi:class III chitinase [Aspergillus cavernicola]|uniref:chitinase n=1 Tax=Aspergillus cavernicola TaxID=176166 RepID=A0ABR4IDX4_9EURO
MAFLKRVLGVLSALAVLESVHAGLDLASNSTVAVYWGQNSFRGSGDLAQQRLGYYCDDPNIDVIILAFLTRINGPGGAPEIDFSSTSGNCDTFSGTNLKHCPEIGEDITKCQTADKTILLSIGGATYNEGGFTSESSAESSADLIWAMFGPEQPPTTATAVHRPFGKAVIDGFDFDFEAAVSNTGAFATRLRDLMDADAEKEYYLTAAPQCPFPDAADKDILNTEVSASIDAVFVQFYNNYCGVNTYTPWTGTTQASFNMDTWDKWALTESGNKDVRVFLGVPANTGAAGTGYLPVAQLQPVISFSQEFESFGGVVMWDVSQAYGNQGFLEGVRGSLGGGEVHVPGQVTTSITTTAPATWIVTTLVPSTWIVSTSLPSAWPVKQPLPQQEDQQKDPQKEQQAADDRASALNLLYSLLGDWLWF